MLVTAPETGARLATTYGHVLLLEPNEERDLEGPLLQLALAAGCTTPTTGKRAKVPPVENREDRIRDAINQVIAQNDPSLMTASGLPRTKDVAVAAGFDVMRDEVEAVFRAM
jgi:hypothetical protein